MKKESFYIQTLGCKVNQYESQLMRENFLRSGYIEAVRIDEADICIVNTCTVTSTSDSKSLRFIRNAVKKRDRCVIATGCMVEDKVLDLSKLAGVRFIVKNKDKHKIPEIIDGSQATPRLRSGQASDPSTSLGTGKRPLDFARDRRATKISGLKGHTRVFVKVQDGCDNACSYCKVRIARGPSRSRPLKEILDECATLIRNGSKEIVLTGICLGAYGRDLSKGSNLSRLIIEMCKIDGYWRLRLSSIEPKDINNSLVRQLQFQKKLCKHVHMPFQSGDTDILRKMNRPYTGKDYLNIVSRLKNAIPDIAISTDIMVGFPGETEKRFQNTLDFITEVRPMRMHVFMFSKREETKAYSYRGSISSVVKKEREDRLLRLAGKLSREFVERCADREVEVLAESRRSKEGYLQGYTESYIKVYIDGPDSLKGRLMRGKLRIDHSSCPVVDLNVTRLFKK